MKRSAGVMWIGLVVGCAMAGGTSEVNRPAAAGGYGRLPLRFEPASAPSDCGALRSQNTEFMARGAGYTMRLRSADVTIAVPASEPPGAGSVVRMRLVDANPAATGVAVDVLSSRSHYLIGKDPSRWRTNVANYGKVRFDGVYPGIDAVYYGHEQQLEYDFVVAPGADPRSVRLAFDGAGDIAIDETGALVAGPIRMTRPVVYQRGSDGSKQPVSGRYLLAADQQVGFEIGQYDLTKPLVIDPVLMYSTYLGGTAADEPGIIFGSGRTIAVDATGHVYVAGHTASIDFPTTPGAGGDGGFRDAFVTKLAPDGASVVYSTYIGGEVEDWANGIAVDAAGSVLITGYSESPLFPQTQGPFCTNCSPADNASIFVTKLTADGAGIVYSVKLGGPNGDSGNAIAVDGAGNAYITGRAWYGNKFPVTGGAAQTVCNCFPIFSENFQSAFVAKLDAASGNLVYATFLGGSQVDVGLNIAVDSGGNAVVTGYTGSSDFPVINAAQLFPGGGMDAFVTRVNASGTAFAYSTYLGGSADENRLTGSGRPVAAVAVDAVGAAYVTGFTTSGNFPATAGAFQTTLRGGWDAYVAKFDAAGSIVYSTLLGGTHQDSGNGVAVDDTGQAFVTGNTYASDFPVVDAIQPSLGGNDDVFVTKLNATGSSVLFSTYVGGSGGDAGRGIAIDAAGSIYVVGNTIGFPNDFPVTAGAFQTAPPGDMDTFVFKIGEPHVNQSPQANAGADQTVEATSASGASVQLDGSASSDGDGDVLSYSWVRNGATVATTETVSVLFGVGTHTVTLTVDDGNGGSASDDVVIVVTAAVEASPASMASALLAETTLAGFQQARGLLQAVILRAPAAGSRDKSSCGQLGAFVNQVQAQSGKHVSAAQATSWIAEANRIRNVIGCR